jgi:hypothetical protein
MVAFFTKINSIITLFPAFLLALTACRSEPPPRVISTPNLLELPDFIYAAGYIQEGDNLKPCYWHGTNRIELPIPIKGSGSSEAITVVDGTVYTAGNIVTGNRSAGSQACYWKGMDRIDLPFPPKITYGYALGITVANGTVYTAGCGYPLTRGFMYSGLEHSRPCYWQDAAKIDLTVPAEAIFSHAKAVAVVNEIVYTAGDYSMPSFRQTDFMDTTNTGYRLYNISFNPADNEMVFAYPVRSIDTGIDMPCYWQGTKRTDIPIPSGTHGSANAITVVNDTAYTAGYYYNNGIWISCYWQGTKRIDLPVPDGAASSFVNAISVVNGIVYTTGFYEYKNCWKPCYWQDTDRIDLPIPEEISRSEVYMYTNSNGNIIISDEIICIAACTGNTIYYWENNILNYSGTIGSGGVISGVCINK